MTDQGENARHVLRRCAQCRLLFEVPEGTDACVVCGAAIDGLALPLDAGAVPTELGDREPTARLTFRDSN
ncbi:MAG TPA: hypothetical protein VN947_00840 [Polyangia bacterium]|nr:hypothetical protein [Polyangia bacterium]